MINTDQISPNIIGLGTDFGINDNKKIIKLIEAAIKTGYILFDTAEKYNNIEIIGKTIEAMRQRDNIYVVYKVEPPKYLPDDKSTLELLDDYEPQKILKDLVEEFIEGINKGLDALKYINCFMFHTPPKGLLKHYPYDSTYFLKLNEKEQSFIKMYDIKMLEIITNNKIKSVGVSNIINPSIISLLKQKVSVSFIENKFNTNELSNMNYRNMLYYSINGIKFIGYSAFGGKTFGSCGSANYDFQLPLIHYSEISHPNTYKIYKKYEEYVRNIYLLVIAFMAKKYGVFQIPMSRNEQRIKDNYENFRAYYDLLTFNMSTKDEYIKNILGYKSRIKIYEYLQDNSHPLFKVIEILYRTLEQNHKSRWEFNILVKQFIYMVEVALQEDYVKREKKNMEKLKKVFNDFLIYTKNIEDKLVQKILYNAFYPYGTVMKWITKDTCIKYLNLLYIRLKDELKKYKKLGENKEDESLKKD